MRRTRMLATSLLSLSFIATTLADAAVRVTTRSGPWRRASTWSGSIVPGPADEAVIASGHRIEFSGPDDSQDECARLLIQPGGELVFKARPVTFTVGGNGIGRPGGIEVQGRLLIGPGVTVTINPDGNAAAEEDGVVVRRGGFLSVSGQVVYEGTAGAVVSDDNLSDIVFTDPSLRTKVDTGSQRMVWRSGQRAGRWYDLTRVTGTTVSVGHASRSNAERTGEPDFTAGLASVSGDRVTGTEARWTDALASGSWWWCATDGPAARVRVRAVDSPSSLQLDRPYGGSGCGASGPYVLRDENQPLPAIDVSERIRPGDTYALLLPATLKSGLASDADFDHQIFLRVEEGAGFDFQAASFESFGKEAWRMGAGSGIRIEGFRGGSVPGRLQLVEVYRYAGEAGLELVDTSNFDLDELFLHWAHPLITLPNEGHGVKVRHSTPTGSADNLRIRRARFDRTNDDFVWWASRAGGTSGVYDSIGKFCPNTASGDSCDGVDTNDEMGVTGGQLRIERNLFANIGAIHGGSCLQAAVGDGNVNPAWTGDGWLARDNVCLNLQSVGCLVTYGGNRAWDRERIWAVNNVCASVWGNGVENIPYLAQNEIIDFGLIRRSTADGVRAPYRAWSNIFRAGSVRTGEGILGRGVTVGVGEPNWAGTTWSVLDNLLILSGIGLQAASWSSVTQPAAGAPRFAHNLVVRNPNDPVALISTGVLDVHTDPAGTGIRIENNIFEALSAPGFQAGEGYNAATADVVDRNVTALSAIPAWRGVLVTTNDFRVGTGITGSDGNFEIRPGSGVWSILTPEGDRPGPRFAGVLAARLPFIVPGLIPAVDPEDDEGDSDGDGLIDRWDNCPAAPNPGWADTDSDGLGDACDP